MNPLFQRKLFLSRYVVVCVLLGAAYSAAFGVAAGLTTQIVMIDAALFAVVAGFEGLALWNILKYGADSTGGKPAKTLYYIVVGILAAGVAAGLESLVLSLAAPVEFPMFVRTIPARFLALVLLYVSYVLCYLSAERSCEDETAGRADNLVPQPSVTEAIERITIKGGQKIKVLSVGEIIYLQAEGDYVAIVTAEGRFLKEQTMKYFEENLPSGQFVRVHRSYIVSVSHISRIEQSGREHSVVLRDATRIRISDTGYKLLRSVLGL